VTTFRATSPAVGVDSIPAKCTTLVRYNITNYPCVTVLTFRATTWGLSITKETSIDLQNDMGYA